MIHLAQNSKSAESNKNLDYSPILYLIRELESQEILDENLYIDLGEYLLEWAKLNNKDPLGILAYILKEDSDRFYFEDALRRRKEEIDRNKSLFDLLEKKIPKERIYYYILSLQKVLGPSPFKDAIFNILNAGKNLYAISDYYNNFMARVKVIDKAEEGPLVKIQEIIGQIVPIRWTIHIDTLYDTRTFEVVFLARNRPITKEGDIPYIVKALEQDGYIIRHRGLAQDIITAILNIEDKNRIEEREGVKAPVIIEENGEVKLYNKEWSKEFTKEDLNKALELLEEIAKYYDEKKFATIIKWGLTAPFNYVLKQNHRWIRWLYLWGRSDSGKSTLGLIITKLYGNYGLKDGPIFGGSNVNTEYQLGRALASTTFPIVINEARNIFQSRDKDLLVGLINKSVEELTARTRKYSGIDRSIPAYAPIIFTDNKYVPNEPALKKRLIRISFTAKDFRKVQEKIKEFKRKIEPELHKLEAIGYYAIKTGLEILNDKDLRETIIIHNFRENEIGETILKSLYTEANREAPEWVKEKIEEEDLKSIELESIELIREHFINKINEAYTKYLGKIGIDEGHIDGEMIITLRDDMEKRVVKVLKANLIPSMRLKNDNVIIMKPIVNEIEEKIVGLGGLKGLADLLEWDYEKYSWREENGKPERRKVVLVPLNKFIEFLKGE